MCVEWISNDEEAREVLQISVTRLLDLCGQSLSLVQRELDDYIPYGAKECRDWLINLMKTINDDPLH